MIEWIIVSRETEAAYWSAFASIGSRHAAMARWVRVLGWKVSVSFANGWLAPEVRE